jgi:hypothetical protein
MCIRTHDTQSINRTANIKINNTNSHTYNNTKDYKPQNQRNTKGVWKQRSKKGKGQRAAMRTLPNSAHTNQEEQSRAEITPSRRPQERQQRQEKVAHSNR